MSETRARPESSPGEPGDGASPAGGGAVGVVAAALLAVAIVVAPVALPFPGLLLHLFAPAPVLWLVWRGRYGAASVAAAGAIGAAGAAGGRPLALGFAVPFVPMVAVLGVALARRWPVSRAVVGSAAATILVGVGSLMARGVDPIEAARVDADAVARVLVEALDQAWEDRPDAAALSAMILRIQPALVVVLSAAAAWLNLLVVRRVARSWTPRPASEAPAAETPPLDDWSLWRAPEPLVFALIAGGLAVASGPRLVAAAGLNLVIVVAFVYVVQGLAVVGFFFRAKGVPLPLRIAGYTLIGPQLALLALVGALGLADLWADFRGLSRQKGTGGTGQ